MFEANGIMVNHAGQPVDEQGKVIVAEQPAGGETLESVQRERDQLRLRVSELEATQTDSDTAPPGDADQRTKAQLKDALYGKSIQYAPSANRVALLALAVEHQV